MQHRFWSKVNKHGPFPNAEAIKHHTEIAGTRCWVWTAGRNGSGYGNSYLFTQRVGLSAHRIAWFLATGEWPKPCALHKCDNRLCVRKLHLFEGTKKDNAVDRTNKHRTHCPKGESHGKAKLSIFNVAAIRQQLARGITCLSLAHIYEVQPAAISKIKCGRTWRA